MRFIRIAAICVVGLSTAGCVAASVVGGAVRSGQKKVDIVLGSGVTTQLLQGKKRLGVSVNGSNSSGQYVVAMGGGGTNASVYSDMLVKEFMRMGYESRVISDVISETSPASKLRDLANDGFDLILVGNMNLSMTTNMGAAMIGGEYAKTGVTSFTVKGLEPQTGRILMILSVEYGTAKEAGRVAADLSALYHDVVIGVVKPSGSGPVARAQRDPVSSLRTAQAAEAEPTQSAAQESAPSARKASATTAAIPTASQLQAPILRSPGGTVDPGPLLPTLTPTMSWNAVGGATGYGVYLRDLTANVVIFSSAVPATVTSLAIPAGKLTVGHKYRWNVRARNTAGFGPYSTYLRFKV